MFVINNALDELDFDYHSVDIRSKIIPYSKRLTSNNKSTDSYTHLLRIIESYNRNK